MKPAALRLAVGITLGLLFVTISVTQADSPDAITDNVPRLALLVGIQEYPKLPAAEQLNGCTDDVAAMKRLLIERFHFAERDIVTLNNEAATGAAVRAALDDLVRRVRQFPPDGPAAQVVFHFSGHGSQVSGSVGR